MRVVEGIAEGYFLDVFCKVKAESPPDGAEGLPKMKED